MQLSPDEQSPRPGNRVRDKPGCKIKKGEQENETKEAANSEMFQNIKKSAESGYNTIVEKSKILLNIDQKEINPNSQQNPGIDAYNNSVNLANNQLNPNNSLGNDINMSNIKNENKNNINKKAEESKKENIDNE